MLLEGTVLKSFPDKNKSIIQLDKGQVIVETRKPLTPGHSFSARVEKVSSQPILKIVSQDTQPVSEILQLDPKTKNISKQTSDITSLKTEYKEHVSRQLTLSDIKKLNLATGQSAEAKVTHIYDRTTAIATIRDKEVIVHFKAVAPPKPGTIVKLTIEPYKQNFRLVTKDKTDFVRSVEVTHIKPLLALKEPFGEMVQKLDSLVTSIVPVKIINTQTDLIGRLIKTLNLLKPQPELIPDSALLKKQVEFSGINYESKVRKVFDGKSTFQIPPNLGRDLKGQLLELVNAIRALEEDRGTLPNQRRQLTDIVQTIRRAIDNIELQQLTNQFTRQENQPIVLQIPNPFIGDKKSIKLYLRKLDDETADRKNEEKEGVLLVFLLDLSVLGNLRVDARLNKAIISLRISVESQAIAQFIDVNLEDFHSRLTDLGFQSEVTCCVTKNVEHEFDNELNQLLINDCERLVDLTT